MVQISERVQGALDWLKTDLAATRADIERFKTLRECAEYEYSIAQNNGYSDDDEYTIGDFLEALEIIAAS